VDVYPSLTHRDVAAALSWLHTAFGLEPLRFDEEGAQEIQFAAVKHGRGMVMLQPELPDDLHGEHAGRGWVYVVVDDPDASRPPAPRCWASRMTPWTVASAATAPAKATSGASGPPGRNTTRSESQGYTGGQSCRGPGVNLALARLRPSLEQLL
jgi:hypothetical protein